MRRSALVLLVVTVFSLAETALYAQNQTSNPSPGPRRSRSDETLEWWNQIGNKLIALAKDFPEEKYDFKVQKDQRTFAENLIHVAAVDYDLISRVAGSHVGPDFGKDKHNPPPDMFKSKAEVVKLLEPPLRTVRLSSNSRATAASTKPSPLPEKRGGIRCTCFTSGSAVSSTAPSTLASSWSTIAPTTWSRPNPGVSFLLPSPRRFF